MNEERTDHDGVFVVRPAHVNSYMEHYRPMCLRHNASSARSLDLPFINFGIAKGRSADRVLIAPTGPMASFLKSGKQLEDLAACSLYVGVTRARASVAFISDQCNELGLPEWVP
jgi:hypothetical protein